MKKIYNKIIIFFFTILILPASCCLLSGCGATPVNDVRGVSFVSNNTAEIKDPANPENIITVPLFELDLNKSYYLPIKVNPSSAYGYTPTFTALSSVAGSSVTMYKMEAETGKFTITNSKFSEVVMKVQIKEFSNYCLVKLKSYPIQIGLYDETSTNKINTQPKISIASGSSYQINVAGIFEDSIIADEETQEKEPTLLLDSKYNFVVEIDDDSRTLINVPNKNRLNFVTFSNYGTAKIKVTLCDFFGEKIENLSFEIDVRVYKECESMDVVLSGANKIASSKNANNDISIDANLLKKIGDNYIIKYKVDLYDEYARLISDESLTINCFVDKTTFATVDNSVGEIIISKPKSDNDLKLVIKVWTSAPLASDEFCMIKIDLTISF